MEKKPILNSCSVVIITRAGDPRCVFLEIKGDGYPIPLIRRQLCWIGGNWFGKDALTDRTPYETLCRELREELSLERPVRSMAELAGMGLADCSIIPPTRLDAEALPGDEARLRDLVEGICEAAAPLSSYLNTTTKEAMDRVDPQNTREGFTTLANYFVAFLDASAWSCLAGLQNRYGNLSNESVTFFTRLEDVLMNEACFSFGHDTAIRNFWISMGLGEAASLSRVPGVSSEYAGPVLPDYAKILERYDVSRRPS